VRVAEVNGLSGRSGGEVSRALSRKRLLRPGFVAV
jgi:hypothetical protein